MSNSLFSNLTDNGLEEQKDVLGGGFKLLESGIYPATIKVAYAGRSASGAMNVTVHADIDGSEYKETIYITNRNGENYYLNKNDSQKKIPLAGFAVMNDLCQVCCGKPLSQMDTENKMLNVYNSDLQKEVPTSVPVITDLIGKPVTLGILKEKRFKVQNTGTGYVETDETRENNVINKVFSADTKQTAYEIAHGLTESPLFCDKWAEKNNGVTVDRTKKKGSAVTSGNPGAIPMPKKAEHKSLFA